MSDRPALLRREIHRATREAFEYHMVGADRAAKHYAKRAARLRYRLAVASDPRRVRV